MRRSYPRPLHAQMMDDKDSDDDGINTDRSGKAELLRSLLDEEHRDKKRGRGSRRQSRADSNGHVRSRHVVMVWPAIITKAATYKEKTYLFAVTLKFGLIYWSWV